MRCQNCGNELGPDEVFCGQCGKPVAAPARPTEMSQALPPRNGLLRGEYQAGTPASPSSFRGGQSPQPQNTQAAPSSAIQPQAPQVPRPQQSTGFYQDATEAMSFAPGSLPGYPQTAQQPPPGFGGSPGLGNYSGVGQYPPRTQAFQTSNPPSSIYPTQASFPPGPVAPGYGMPPRMTPPPPRRGGNLVLIIACVCLACAVVAIGAFGALFLLRDNTPKHHTSSVPTIAVTPTTAPIPTPTAVPSPSPAPSPSPSPSPAATATPAPDANFIWCDTTCTLNGFLVEYPSGWQQAPTADHTGTQFTNPAQQDVYTAFKTPGATSSSASDLVNQDLNAFATKPGYTAPTTSLTATIGGENWVYEKATYQLNAQVERIVVYATVHGGKAYIIELEAQDTQFDSFNTQYFEAMIGRFQFWPSSTP